jgi:hypothetical protein
MLRNKMATLLTIVSAMLISAGMTWQQRLLFVGGIAFGLVVEALPLLVDDLKERAAEWRRLRQLTTRAKAA